VLLRPQKSANPKHSERALPTTTTPSTSSACLRKEEANWAFLKIRLGAAGAGEVTVFKIYEFLEEDCWGFSSQTSSKI